MLWTDIDLKVWYLPHRYFQKYLPLPKWMFVSYDAFTKTPLKFEYFVVSWALFLWYLLKWFIRTDRTYKKVHCLGLKKTFFDFHFKRRFCLEYFYHNIDRFKRKGKHTGHTQFGLFVDSSYFAITYFMLAIWFDIWVLLANWSHSLAKWERKTCNFHLTTCGVVCRNR